MFANKFVWIGLLIVLSVFGHSLAQDADDFDVEDDSIEEDVKTSESKEKYVPPIYQKPRIDKDKFHLVELFEDTKVIGKTWLKSESKKEGAEEAISKYNGEWFVGSPAEVILENDYGLVVSTKARHHAISSKLKKTFEWDGKPLVVQYEVKYGEGQECGGGYLKLLRDDVADNLKEFNDKTPYVVMFGPDKCGMTSKVHMILKHKNPKNGTINEHHAKQPTKSMANYFEDKKTHLYTLVIKPDNTYRVSIDHKEIMSGSLLTDLEPSIIPPKQIADEKDKKPDDWDDRPQIEDPDAKKPDDWDESQPKEIEDADAVKPDDWLEEEDPFTPDPEAQKPNDWDEEMDGEWEARKVPNPKCKDRSGCGEWKRPMKANPMYKGKWTHPKIKNPNYKGVWTARLIDNPAYFDANPYQQLEPIGAIGIELWTMSSGIVFDNIIVTNDESLAREMAKETFDVKQTQEQLYQAATGESKSLLNSAAESFEDKPLLWVVAIISLIILIIVLCVYCFGRKSTSSSTAHYKKTDELVEDEEEANMQEMEDLEQEKTADDEQEDPTKSGIETGSQSKESSPSESKPASPTRELLQEEKQQNSADASPRPTRRPRPRRQD